MRPRRAAAVLAGVTIALGGGGVAVATQTGLFSAPHAAVRPHDNAAAPANDNLVDAIVVDSDNPDFLGTTAGATTEAGEPRTAPGAASVWFSWTPAVSGPTLVLPLGSVSTAVHIYTGKALGSLTEVGTPGRLNGRGSAGSQVTVTAATTYQVQVISTTPGSFEFETTAQDGDGFAGSGPSNDSLVEAEAIEPAISGNSTDGLPGSTVGGTTERHEPAGADHSVWYLWSRPAVGATMHLTVTPGDLTVGAFSGTGLSDLVQVAPDTAGAVDIPSTGAPLHIRVGGAEHSFTLSATVTGGTPVDNTPPVVVCTPPSAWTVSLTVACTATDSGSGLAKPTQASFTLPVELPAKQSSVDVATGQQTVCDVAGNCTNAGPYAGLKIDQTPPAVDCDAVPDTWSGGQAAVACTASDDGSGLANHDDASFTLSTSIAAGSGDTAAAFGGHAPVCDTVGNCTDVPSPGTAKVDRAPPVVTCSDAPTGWQHTDVTVTCTAVDADSGLADPTQSKFTVSTTVPAATADAASTIAVTQVCDVAGNCAAAGPFGPFMIDTQAPVIHCDQPSGWHAGTSLTVACTASDPAGGSGLAPGAPGAFSLTATIPAGTSSATASTDTRQVCDVAGNCAAAGPFTGVELDDLPPALTCQPTPTDWQPAGVHDQCTAGDTGSGVAAADSTFTLSGDVPAGQTSASVAVGRRRVCDVVGNCASTPELATGRVDRAAPVVTCTRPTGMQHAEVTVSCAATDEGSGLVDPASFTLRTSVGPGRHDAAAMTESRVVCDDAGNCTTAGPVGPIDIDRSVPAPGSAPTFAVPTVVHVLSARSAAALAPGVNGSGSVAVPFRLPTPTAADGIAVRLACLPNSAGLFPVGSTTVVCAARDDADRSTTHAFPVDVALAPALAATTPSLAGSPFTAVGIGFAPGSTVSGELDGLTVTSGRSADGTFVTVVPLPAGLNQGQHQVVLRGVASDGQPQLVVIPVTVTDSAAASAQPTPTGTPSAGGSSPAAGSTPVAGQTPTPQPGSTSKPTTVGQSAAPAGTASQAPGRATSPRPHSAKATTSGPAGTRPTVTRAGAVVPGSSFTPAPAAAPGGAPGGGVSRSQPVPTAVEVVPTPSAPATQVFQGAPSSPRVHATLHAGTRWWVFLLAALGALVLLGLVVAVALRGRAGSV